MTLAQPRTALAALAAAACLLASCGSREEVEVRPITPSFQVNKARVPIGSPMEVTYRFEIAPEAQPIEKDYRVFVHFVDSRDDILFTDDHDPVPATNSWKPGSTVEYSRTVFVPLYPYLGNASVEMGLYIPATGERLRLSGTDTGQLGYRVGELTLLDQKENIFLVSKEGWHQLESMIENPAIEWQWTKKEAVISFKNPKVDALLYLEADTNVEAVEEPLEVSIFVGEHELTRFTVESRDVFLKKIPIPASALGMDDWVDLKIVNSQSFVPAEMGLGDDPRELGLRVYHLYVDPQPGT